MSLSLQNLFQLAITKQASDLHLSAGQVPLLRIDGELTSTDEALLDNQTLKKLLFEIMTPEQQEKFTQDLDIDFAYNTHKARFRINIYHQQHGIAAAIRIIPATIPTLTSLNLPPIFQTLAEKKHGLVLITGPTGSGKSTSLAALINHMNHTQAAHIVTIEDPIEFMHVSLKSLITQREVPRDALSFQHALRAALREDPDVICIAELRDLETIRLALTAAETGHLVLATLHTGSAPKSIDRLIDVFPGNEKEMVRTMLSESLLAVISQQLRKQENGRRRAVFEILVSTPAIRHLIRENKTAQIYSAMQTGKAMGMCTFD